MTDHTGEGTPDSTKAPQPGTSGPPSITSGGFALVLSGGAALGCAHLGVLDALEARNLEPREIVGTSMGALVGAARAAGFTAEETAGFFRRFAGLTRWVRFSWSRPALLEPERVKGIFHDLFGDRRMGDTILPFRAAATDFLTGAPRIFGPGDDVPLKDALLASMAIPVIFPPVRIEDRPHVDGYLAANLPVEHVSDPGGPVLAVDVIDPGILPPSDPESGRGVLAFMRRGRDLYRAAERAFFLMVHEQSRKACAGRNNVITLTPSLEGFKPHQFHRWEALRDAGRRCAEAFFAEGSTR